MTTLPLAVVWLLRLSTPWQVADVQQLCGCGLIYTDSRIRGYLGRLVRLGVLARTAPHWYAAGDPQEIRRFRTQVRRSRKEARGNSAIYRAAWRHRRNLEQRDAEVRSDALRQALAQA